MTAQPQKPVIVISHGCWHRPIHYYPLMKALHEAGYEVLCPALACEGIDDSIADKTYSDDAAILQAAMTPFLDNGREVILLGHSAGGMPATEAAAGYTIKERAARHLTGGVRAVLFLAAYAISTKGQAVSDLPPGAPDMVVVEVCLAILSASESITQQHVGELQSEDCV